MLSKRFLWLTLLLVLSFVSLSTGEIREVAPIRHLQGRNQQESTVSSRTRTLRGSNQHRRLPGSFDIKSWGATETGIVSGVLVLLLLLGILYCCCGCSLMDILVLFCCYELCCDRGVDF
jgi:hypothetical protein